MAVLHLAEQHITAKVVYWGAPGAGASTNAVRLHELLPYECTPLERMRVETVGEDVLTFSYRRQDAQLVSGFATFLEVLALPGAVDDALIQGEALSGTDALVFIADARPDGAAGNIERLLELERRLSDLDLRLACLPLVIQVNHTDHPQALPTPLVVRELNPYGVPVVPAMARSGRGVLETHDRVGTLMLKRISEQVPGNTLTVSLTQESQHARVRDEQIIRRHLRALRGSTPDGSDLVGVTGPPAPSPRYAPSYEGLPPGERVRVRYEHPSVEGFQASEVLEVLVDSGLVDLELALTASDGEVRRLTLELHHQAPPPLAPPSRSGEFDRGSTATPLASEHLPEEMQFSQVTTEERPQDPPWTALVLGIVGVVGGALVGLTLGYLLFV